MAEKYTPTTLVSSDGSREWTTESAEQETNLRARGWATKAEKPASKSTTK